MLVRAQAVQLLALHLAIRDGDVRVTSDDDELVAGALDCLADAAEECALQLGGM